MRFTPDHSFARLPLVRRSRSRGSRGPPFADAPAPTFGHSVSGLEYSVEFHALVQRVQSEFLEMPGLRLTPAQAGRLLDLDPQACQRVINALVKAAFLRWTPDGRIVRAES
jgi:hypothetical protein